MRIIGEIESFPSDVAVRSAGSRGSSERYADMQVKRAPGYGAREEIVAAVRSSLAEQAGAGLSLRAAPREPAAQEIAP